MEEWWRSLNSGDLKRILEKEQKLGRFKPRYLIEKQWLDEKWNQKHKTKSCMGENQQPVHEQPQHQLLLLCLVTPLMYYAGYAHIHILS